MAQHRLTPPHGVLEARLRRETGGTSHRRRPDGLPVAQALTALALAGVVAGGAAVSVTELSSSRADATGRPDALRPPERPEPAGTPPPAAATPAEQTDTADAPDTTAAPDAVSSSGDEAAGATTPTWRADGPGAFRSTPWNTVRTGAPRVDGDTLRVAVTGPGQRAELEPDMPVIGEGDEYWFAFSVRLDDHFPAQGSSRQVIAQWKNDGPGAAPLDLRVQGGRLALHGGDGHPSGPTTTTRNLGPAPVERWSQVTVRVRFSADPHRGAVSVWQDGEQVLDDYRPPGGTLYPGQSSYLKTGLSRDPMITRPAGVAFRDWRVGTSAAAVA